MLDAVTILEDAAEVDDPATVFTVTQTAIASALKVIMRADDSSGIIGDACRHLLALHPVAAARAVVPVPKLVDWMMKFQFDNEVDFFEIDPLAYAPALGEKGIARYRGKLAEIERGLGPKPPTDRRWSSPDSHTRFVLEWNAQRLAVLDRDVDAIIRTHARDYRVAAWLEDTAEALEEIGEIDLAIDWAWRATEFDNGHQSLKAAGYWCTLLSQHRPDDLVAARLEVFRRWPSSTSAGRLYDAAGTSWHDYRDEVFATLASRPRDAVLFALLSLKEVQVAWDLAHSLELHDADVWALLAKAYEKVDPLAVLPILTDLVEIELTRADAKHYRVAARRLKKMRALAAGNDKAADVLQFIADLRETHRRRPRLQQEFDRAGLP